MSVLEQNPLHIEDDDSKKRSKKSLRHVPGIRVDAEKENEREPKEKKVARIDLGSLFKQKSENEPEEKSVTPDAEKRKVWEEDEDDKRESDDEPANPDEVLEVTETEVSLPGMQEQELGSFSPATEIEPTEAPYWEQEGEFGEEEEINLQPPRTVEASAREASPNTVFTNETQPGSPESPEALAPDAEASVDESSEPTEPIPDMSGGGETPPPDSPEDLDEDAPEPPRNPIPTPVPYSSWGHDTGGGFTPPGSKKFGGPSIETRSLQDDLDDAEYRGRKQGTRKGLLTGLAAGWYFFGHRGKKKQAARYEKALDSKDQHIRELHTEQSAASERLQALQRNQATIEASLAEKEQRRATAPLEAPNTQVEARQPFVASLFEKDRPEHIRNAPVRTETETRIKLLPEEQEITEETYRTKEGRRVETSSWHRIEIDAKTGKPVENPEVEYGEEFKRETRREVLHAASTDDSSPAAVQLGSMATTASLNAGQPAVRGQVPVGVPLNNTASPVPQPKTVQTAPQSSALQNPAVWVVIVILVILLLVFLIR